MKMLQIKNLHKFLSSNHIQQKGELNKRFRFQSFLSFLGYLFCWKLFRRRHKGDFTYAYIHTFPQKELNLNVNFKSSELEGIKKYIVDMKISYRVKFSFYLRQQQQQQLQQKAGFSHPKRADK